MFLLFNKQPDNLKFMALELEKHIKSRGESINNDPENKKNPLGYVQ